MAVVIQPGSNTGSPRLVSGQARGGLATAAGHRTGRTQVTQGGAPGDGHPVHSVATSVMDGGRQRRRIAAVIDNTCLVTGQGADHITG
ncbi:hypothetical protein D3C81_1346200 [compost metagenome]